MEQASSMEQSPLRALLIPGRSRTRVMVGRGQHVLASFWASGSPGVVGPDLIEMVAESFDVGAWFVDAGGFQRVLMGAPGVVEVCGFLGVELIGLAPMPAVEA